MSQYYVTLTTQPTATPSGIADKAYNAVNNGSFAVVVVTACFLVYAKRSISAWLSSPAAQSFIELMEQIKRNQEHIQSISLDVDRLDKTTADLLDQLGELQQEIKSSGEISRAEYRQIVQELNHIRLLLDRRGQP
jgi:septal ring factor EnvC (AmiA/AmiB activator)